MMWKITGTSLFPATDKSESILIIQEHAADVKVRIFVPMLVSGTPAATIQLVATQLYDPASQLSRSTTGSDPGLCSCPNDGNF